MYISFRHLQGFRVVSGDRVLGTFESVTFSPNSWECLDICVSAKKSGRLSIPTSWVTRPTYGPKAIHFQLSVRQMNGLLKGSKTQDAAGQESLDAGNLFSKRVKFGCGNEGMIQDLLLDDASWRIDALVVGRKRWIPESSVRVPVKWLERNGDSQAILRLNHEEQHIDQWPAFNPSQPVNHIEGQWFDFFGRLV